MNFDLLILSLRLTIILLLYGFLGLVVLAVRRDLRRAAAHLELSRTPAARLFVIDPGLSDLVPGEVLALAEINTIGRAPSNTLSLSDSSVSAEHALIRYRDGRWWIEDLGSTNGTLVNGRRVQQPTVLVSGDIITLGRVKLRLEGA